MNSMMELRNALHERLNQKMLDASRKLAGGQARDYAEYKQATGRIRGLADAVSEIDVVFKNLLDEENK